MNTLTLENKISVITGANSGIGKAAAIRFAQAGGTVIMACRNEERGRAALEDIKAASDSDRVELMLVDMSSQESIRKFCDTFLMKYDRLDVLVNNAANFDPKQKKAFLTEDGIETIFATNHIGSFLMTTLLLDVMKASSPARIINIASKGLLTFPFITIKFDDLNMQAERYSYVRAYYHSKIAQIMFTYDLAERLEGTGVTANIIRVPSVQVDIDKFGNIPTFMKKVYAIKQKNSLTSEQMAETYLYLAAAPEVENVTGKYFDEKNKPVKSSKKSYDVAVWKRLWEVSLELSGQAESQLVTA